MVGGPARSKSCEGFLGNAVLTALSPSVKGCAISFCLVLWSKGSRILESSTGERRKTMKQGLEREALEQAAAVIREADALLVGAGAGMGVDSGLPDFRGDKGFWKAYPPFEARGLSFQQMANPRWFFNEPKVAWGFYGHRLHLYRDTVPHEGFAILLRWASQMEHGVSVYTSNVDGQFQKAGYPEDRIVECHGSLHHLQCVAPCTGEIWSAEGTDVEVDETTFEASMPLPLCGTCGLLARPNILMFGDHMWVSDRSSRQERALSTWLEQLGDAKLAIVECGAGTAVPSVRWACESAAQRYGGTLIRVNPREAHGNSRTISLAAGALATLREIDALLSG